MRNVHLFSHLKSVRLRAVLSLGVVLGLGATGTFAFWTSSVAVTGTTFTAGSLSMQVDNTSGYSNVAGTLSMSNMAPGATSAQILTIKNSGSVPLKWTLTQQLSGTNAASFSTAGSLSVTVKTGASIAGSGNAATCSGGTVVGAATTLTTTASPVVATRQPTTAGSGVGAGGTVPLCFQVTFDPAAPTSLEGLTAQDTFTFTGTSDIS
ncbi:MAG: hypothetical protein JWR52_1678 [Marmoricola sp.]|nr:hypothetical protein [Marmoricola sp.]